MVLLVLALIWGALLVSWLRSRTADTFSDSVGTFRRHLTVLERATPNTVPAANRLRSVPNRASGARSGPAARDLARRQDVAGPARPVPSRPGPARSGSSGPAALRRRRMQRRRRDVFVALVAGTLGSFAVALLPGMSVMWSVQVLFDVLLVAYVALLIRIRNLAAEREVKLRFMPGARPALRPSYDFGGYGYGDIELRRAVN